MHNSFLGTNQLRGAQLTGSGRVLAEGGAPPEGQTLAPLFEGCTLLFSNNNEHPDPYLLSRLGGGGSNAPKASESREKTEAGAPTPGWEEEAAIIPETLLHPSAEPRPRSN